VRELERDLLVVSTVVDLRGVGVLNFDLVWLVRRVYTYTVLKICIQNADCD
jgi:hypothetical protein